MRAGALRHHIMIQSRSTSKNSYGEQTRTWTSNVSTWANVEPLRGREYFAAQQVQTVVSHKIETRYITLKNSTDITPNNARIYWDGRVFNIHSVIKPFERDIRLQMMCSEEG